MKKKLLICFFKNFISIVRFNFHYLPFKQAIKLPIFVKDAKLHGLGGKVSIRASKIYPGMIKLGFPCTCMIVNKGFHWLNRGRVIFKGSCMVGNDSVIETCSDAQLIFGDNILINGGLRLTCSKKIVLGKDVLCSWNVNIYDTDFHRIKDATTNIKKETCSSDINIGDNCFIGFGCSLLKGSKLGDFCILGAESLFNKNYEKSKYLVIAGNPAKIIKGGYYLDRYDCSPEWNY